LRAALLAMSGELGRVASYVTQSLNCCPRAAGHPAGSLPPARPSAEPGSPAVRRTASPAGYPARDTADDQARCPASQAGHPGRGSSRPSAWPPMGAAAWSSLLSRLVPQRWPSTESGSLSSGRGGTGSTGNTSTDDQFLAQQNAAHHATKGSPAVKAHPVKGSQAVVAHPAKGRHALKAHHTAKANNK